MNTFLPYADFTECAKVLDNKRLYKQIVECKQILECIELKGEESKTKEHRFIPWRNHPAVLMWEGYSEALRAYQIAMLKEWFKRRWSIEMVEFDDLSYSTLYVNPLWLGDERLHKSHRAMLYNKDSSHYLQFREDYMGIAFKEKVDYYWPVRKGNDENKVRE